MSILRTMKKVRLINKVRKTLRGSSRGVTLIELLIALALFGIIAFAFAGGLQTASRAVFTADVRTNAESLARSQMEYVKNQPYQDAEEGEPIYQKIADIPGSYSIWSYNYDDEVVESVIGVPWDTEDNQPLEEDNGLQRIKLVVKHDDRVVMTLVGYKVDR